MVAAAAWLAAAMPAHAQAGLDLTGPDTIAVTGDARIAIADGEESWLQGGTGKTRFGGADSGSPKVRPVAAEANLIWQPHFTWSLTGTLVVTAQHGQDRPVDLSEAALGFKPMTSGRVRVSARAGYYWPPVSLEHDGPDWAVTDTITPSAINSWIGEEVKVGGAELTLSAPLGSQRVAATVGGFGLNDTSGTLLAFRGWALHDEKATAFGLQPLPPLNAFMQSAQAPRTRPAAEIDHRLGWYGKLAWAPVADVELQFFHYDNRADPEAVTDRLQWGWRTRFSNLGAKASVGSLDLRAQALSGRTEMGFPIDGRIWVNTSFRSAFLLVTRRLDRGSLSARIEAFGTKSRGSVLDGRYSEHGWASTLAARRELCPGLNLLAEAVHVESTRAARAEIGLSPRQRQNQLQLSLRLHL